MNKSIVSRWRIAPCRRCLTSKSTRTSSQTNKTKGQGFLAWYSAKLDTHPLPTMAISSGLIAGGGDFCCQYMIEKRKGSSAYDVARTARFTLLGTALVAPLVRAWYVRLHRLVPGTQPTAVATRVALDQFGFAPPFMSLWLSCLWTLEGERDATVVINRLQESLPSVVVVNWGLWIPAQVLNFRFVPVKFQVLYSNVVALLWNIYLSYSQTRKQEQTPLEKAGA